MSFEFLGLSLLRAVIVCALFVGSWLLAYVIGQFLVGAGLLPCSDAAECELMVGIQECRWGAPYFISCSL